MSSIQTIERYKVLVTLIVALLPLGLSGQSAPDITVTDSDGVTHQLYADYLDQGKSVLIDIFFSSCPPCQSIAGDLEQLYQQWGAGTHDVQFIQISNQEWETDVTVNAYKLALGITFPACSAEGGSIDAVNAFVNGEFGDFFGAPTYIVVSPDGSVQWNVDGFGIDETIQAIDDALFATGAQKPTTSTGYESGQMNHLELRQSRATLQVICRECIRDTDYYIYHLSGRMMDHGRLASRIENQLGTSVDISHWPAGIYILHLLDDRSLIESVKFVVF